MFPTARGKILNAFHRSVEPAHERFFAEELGQHVRVVEQRKLHTFRLFKSVRIHIERSDQVNQRRAVPPVRGTS